MVNDKDGNLSWLLAIRQLSQAVEGIELSGTTPMALTSYFITLLLQLVLMVLTTMKRSKQQTVPLHYNKHGGDQNSDYEDEGSKAIAFPRRQRYFQHDSLFVPMHFSKHSWIRT